MTDASAGYEASYRSGGFGYEARRDEWRDWAEEHYIKAFDLRPGATLLDVGCGDGFWSGLFSEFGFTVTGLDLSVAGIEVAQQKYPACEFRVGNAEEPLLGGERRFDVVFCRAISHLCATDLLNPATLRVMANMAAATERTGVVLMSYYTQRDRKSPSSCPYHLVSDLLRLVEVELDPWRMDVVGGYVQIAAKHRQAS